MKTIILDRDGVINEDSDAFIKSPDEWVPVPGSLEAITRLNHAGYIVTVVTNQSGLARGFFDLNTLSAIHRKMSSMLAELGGRVDAIFFCPHGPDDGCECRKPSTGMFKEVAKRLQVDIKSVVAVGDSLRDLQAATKAGSKPVLVRTGKGSRTEEQLSENDLNNVDVYDDLAEVVNALLVKDA